MTLKTSIAADMENVFFNTDEFAESVTYNGTANVPALVKYLEDLDDGRSGIRVARAEIFVRSSDVQTPSYRDTVVIGSRTWRVARIEEGDGNTWTLGLERDERPTWT